MKLKKILALPFICLILSSCGEVIDSGHRGIEIKFGKVTDKSLEEGFYMYNPFSTSIKEIDTRVKKITTDAQTYTKDVQQANIQFVVNAGLDASKVHILYKEYGVKDDGVESIDLQNKIIIPIVTAEVKSIIGIWNATDLISNRDKVSKVIMANIKAKLADNYIIVTNFELTNVSYAAEFEKAVESKVTAIQRAEEAKNNTVKIREEAQQRIISAKAEAESMRIRADALSTNKNLIEYEQVQVQKEAVVKWDGKLPSYMMGNSTPFINIKN